MKYPRIFKILTTPYKMLWAALYPRHYANLIGVRMKGKVVIYGSSYKVFGSEPCLVTLGNNVYISLDVRFICHDGSVLTLRKDFPKLDIISPIVVGDNVFIGAGSCILPGVKIGKNCIIGAHAVVTKDVLDNSVVAGNPAKFIKTFEEYKHQSIKNSTNLGDLTVEKKVKAYKLLFNINE